MTDRVTATIFEYVDVKGLADEALKALGARGCHRGWATGWRPSPRPSPPR